MKKYIALIGMSALVSILPASPTLAQNANAAVVIDDSGCVGFVPTDTGGFGPFIFTPDGAHAVLTSSGVQILTCHFDVPDWAVPASATRASGFLCGTYFGTTNDTKMVASAGGRATLVCKVTPGS